MFDELDASLRRLLTSGDAPEGLREADVSFATPMRDYAPTRPTVNMYLHQIQEKRQLRDPAPQLDRSGPTLVQRPPPLRVDCTYLLTAWSDPTLGGDLHVTQEHGLLGLALTWLAGFGVLPPAVLSGALAGQPFPPPLLVGLPRTADGGAFWTALQVAPRPALTLVVTIALDLAGAVDLGIPVATRDVRLAQVGSPRAASAPALSSPAQQSSPAQSPPQQP